MTTIKLLHFADLHLGVETHGTTDPATGLNSRVIDFLNTLDAIVDAAIGEGCDLAIFAGDAFKNPRPSPTLIREFSKRIKRLSEEMPILLLVGNHDAPKSVHRASSMDVFEALEIENVTVGGSPGSQLIPIIGGEFYLAWMPFPFRERLMTKEEYREASIGEIDEIFRIKVQHMLIRMANEAQKYDCPRILAGHFGVVGADPGTATAYFGHDVLINAETLAQHWDYVALGHYHGYQVLHKDPPVIYSGAPERISFNEEDEAKGYVIATIDRGGCNYEFHELPSRAFKTLEIDLRDITNPTEFAINAIKETIGDELLHGSIMRLKLQLNAEQKINEREIEAALSSVETLQIIKEVEDLTRMRLEEESVSSMSPVDLVEHYFSHKGLDGERRHVHVRAAKETIGDVDSI
jgi:exonuclease SbcD